MSKTQKDEKHQWFPAMAKTENHSKDIESGQHLRYNSVATKPTGKGLAAIYRQELIDDVTLFTSQSSAKFYDELFSTLDVELPRAKTGRRGFPKEAMLNAFVVSACEGFGYVTDLWDYLNNNRIIAHYCGFDITRPLPSYWTFDRFLKKTRNGDLKDVMAALVKKLYDLGIVDTSFIGLDSTPVMANTAQNNPKSFAKNKYSNGNHPKSDRDCALGVHSASNQHDERNYEFYWGYKNHILVDCISGLPIYELTTTADVADSTMVEAVLEGANEVIPIEECTFIGDKGYDAKHVYNTVKDVYNGNAVIPLNKRNTKNPDKLPSGRLVCEAGLPMCLDGKSYDRNRVRQKYCCPFRNSKTGKCPCNHKNWNNGRKNRGCTKYKTIPDDFRLSIDRDCFRFKRIYALRTECERYNSRFKATGQERLWVRNGVSAANLNTISHIAALAVALAATLSGNRHSYRSLKFLRRAG